MPIGPITRTAQDVIDRVKRQFGDESGAQVTDTDIIRWINSAQSEINRTNKIIKGIASIPTVAGTFTYTFPAVNIMNVESLNYNGRQLDYISFIDAQSKVLADDPTTVQTGTPYMWYEWGDQIYLYPKPDAVGTLSLYYIAYPAQITVAANTLGLADLYFEAIVQFVLSQAYEQDDDWTASQYKQTQGSQSLTDLASDADRSNRGTYSVITIIDEDF